MARIKTVWELRTYDVWGNAEDGYDVNDSFVVDRAFEAQAKVTRYNEGTPRQFDGAALSEYQIKRALGCACAIDVHGDDTTYYVHRRSDGYPLGELVCTSHESLSPIRETNNETR